MGKLKFKNSKSSKPVVAKSEGPSPATRGPNPSANPPVSVDVGWSSAQSFPDLNGAAIIVVPNSSNSVVLLHELVPDDDVTVLDSQHVVNFFDGEYPIYHRVEPNSVKQVFQFIPVDDSKHKSLVSKRTVDTYAIKLGDQYLSFDKSTKSLTTSYAISDLEIFTLAPEEGDSGDVRWKISIQDQYLIYDKKFQFSANPQSFVIRVHTKNTVGGKQLKQLDSQDSATSSDLKKAIRQLYKDTNGKVQITPGLITSLNKAMKSGKLNEQVIVEKLKYTTRG